LVVTAAFLVVASFFLPLVAFFEARNKIIKWRYLIYFDFTIDLVVVEIEVALVARDFLNASLHFWRPQHKIILCFLFWREISDSKIIIIAFECLKPEVDPLLDFFPSICQAKKT